MSQDPTGKATATNYLPLLCMGIIMMTMMANVATSHSIYATRADYHTDYTKPYRWYGVPGSPINEIRRVDAKGDTCGTLYAPEYSKTNTGAQGWIDYGLGYSSHDVTRDQAIAQINKNCY